MLPSTDKFYYYLDLPEPTFLPEQVATEELVFRRMVDPALKSRLLQPDGSYQNITSYSRLKPVPMVTDWLLEHIPELAGHIREVGIQVHENSNRENGLSAQHPVHTDGKRGRHVLCYFYSIGGGKPETVWWQEKDQPVYRDVALFNVNQPNKLDGLLNKQTPRKLDLNGLTELQRVSFEPGRWAIFRSDVLHSVHGVETERVGLTVGFSDDHVYNMLVDKYGIL
jgi:hypothetical protein